MDCTQTQRSGRSGLERLGEGRLLNEGLSKGVSRGVLGDGYGAAPHKGLPPVPQARKQGTERQAALLRASGDGQDAFPQPEGRRPEASEGSQEHFKPTSQTCEAIPSFVVRSRLSDVVCNY